MRSENVPLAPLTTLRLGGAARTMAVVGSEDELAETVTALDARGEPLFVLGRGSNVVVGDEGFDGTVLRMGITGVAVSCDGGSAVVDVGAGEDWDELVARAVEQGWVGVESMSGIPGLVGATPIQNVGAYGQEVCETLVSVRVFDRRARAFVTMAGTECGFAYRTSLFKKTDRYIVTQVRFAFRAGRDGDVRYAELARALRCKDGERVPLASIRATVVALRREKGMVVDASDPDSVSAGSFFTNPIVGDAALAIIEARVAAENVLRPGESMPRFPSGDGGTKLSAGWLIERAGFRKGHREGRVGVSTKHALALVNRGGATTAELLTLARAIRDRVRARFGAELVPEPVMVGCRF